MTLKINTNNMFKPEDKVKSIIINMEGDNIELEHFQRVVQVIEEEGSFYMGRLINQGDVVEAIKAEVPFMINTIMLLDDVDMMKATGRNIL